MVYLPHATPADVVDYKHTPAFTESTIPAGLLRAHHTKAGVWARIVVTEGVLRFRVDGAEHRLEPGVVGVAAPEQLHEVEPDGPVVFHVEFCRAS